MDVLRKMQLDLNCVKRLHGGVEERRPVFVIGEVETDSAWTAVLLDISPHLHTHTHNQTIN